jgi:hypothetical protein
VDVVASDGTIVGSGTLQVSALTAHAATIDPLRVAIDGNPSTATGSCGPGTPPTGDYRFSDVTIEGTNVSMTVTWGSETPPGAAWCIATSTLADGSITSQPFTMSGSPHSIQDMQTPKGTVDFNVTCEAYTNQAAGTDPGSIRSPDSSSATVGRPGS